MCYFHNVNTIQYFPRHFWQLTYPSLCYQLNSIDVINNNNPRITIIKPKRLYYTTVFVKCCHFIFSRCPFLNWFDVYRSVSVCISYVIDHME